MLNDDIIANLLNLSNFKTKKNFENDKIIQFFGETACSEQVCPRCRKPTKKIHDYRMQTVKLAMFRSEVGLSEDLKVFSLDGVKKMKQKTNGNSFSL